MVDIVSQIDTVDLPRALSLQFEAGNAVEVQGASGIGKSAIAEQYAKAQGEDYGYFELNGATAILPDIVGVLMPEKESFIDYTGETHTMTAARFAYPHFMRDKFTKRPAATYQRGMLVIEEYGQMQGDSKRACGQIIWTRRNGEHTFPEKTDILLLSNRPEDRSGVTKDFDFLIGRRASLKANASFDGWAVWAHEHGISNMSLAFAKRNEGTVFANKAPEKQGPWLTPRSLAMADSFITTAMKANVPLDDPFMRVNIAGLIGDGNAHIYIAFAKIRDKLPSLTSILQDPVNAKLPDEPDQRMFLCFDLAAKARKENFKAIVAYIKRMPSDFSMAFYKSAMKRDPVLRSTKEFGDWAVENVQLLSAVNAA